jgi:hypothetical protein
MLFGPCAQDAGASFLSATNSLCARGVGFVTAMMACRVQPTLILSRTGWQAFEIRARHDGSSVTKLLQPLGFLYGWIPTVKKCHSISD